MAGYDDYKQLTPEQKKELFTYLVKFGRGVVVEGDKLRREALQAAVDHFKHLGDAELRKQIHNGYVDAWRHAYWSARMATTKGFEKKLRLDSMDELFLSSMSTESYPAYEIGYYHEWFGTFVGKPPQPEIEFSMDMHNNKVGLTIGESLGMNASREDIIKEVDKALKDGRLIWIKDTDKGQVLTGKASYCLPRYKVEYGGFLWLDTDLLRDDEKVETDITGAFPPGIDFKKKR
jgi:hypothetical protein